MQQVRNILYSENNSRFKEKEREGHVEDLLLATILDIRFKLMNFAGCTSRTKSDTERYLRAAYESNVVNPAELQVFVTQTLAASLVIL